MSNPGTDETGGNRQRRRPQQGTVRRDQAAATIIGIVLLALAMLLQPLMTSKRNEIVYEGNGSLDSLMISFPRLALGGFRGLAASWLWIQAEEDKNDRKWEQLETKYDVIGALEPYFVTVYIYHAWNQAYNLSAQWNDQDAKYKWVLDGLAYLYKGEDFNPQSADLVLEQGQMYFMKIGGAFERIYYRAHWRSDISRFHELDETSLNRAPDVTEGLKLVHKMVVEQADNHFHVTELPNPMASSASATRLGWGISITDPDLFKYRADGKPAGDPVNFRYGLSPFYFAYVEYKRCVKVGHPTTMGLNIIDGEPAMSLRMWCRDDLYYTQQTMAALFGPDNEAGKMDTDTLRTYLDELRDCLRNVDMIAPASVDEFRRHLAGFPYNENVHRNHIYETQGYQAIGKAESKMLDAMVAWNNAGRQMKPEVRQTFLLALPEFDNAYNVTEAWVNHMYPQKEGQYANADRADFERYANAVKAQKAGLERMLANPDDPQPDTSFLFEEVVEK